MAPSRIYLGQSILTKSTRPTASGVNLAFVSIQTVGLVAHLTARKLVKLGQIESVDLLLLLLLLLP